MPQRTYMSHLEPEPVVVDGQTLLVHAIHQNQIRVQTPPGGVLVRNVPLQLDENFLLGPLGWVSYTQEKSTHSLKVRRLDKYEDGTPAMRNAVLALFVKAVETYARDNPRKLIEAAVIAASNACRTREGTVAEAEKAYNAALDDLVAAELKDQEAREALDAFDRTAPRPR